MAPFQRKNLGGTTPSHLDTVQYVYVLAGLLFIAGLILLVWFGRLFFLHRSVSNSAQNNVHTTSTPSTANCDARRVLDGVCVSKGDERTQIVGVMIENHIDARPQSGLPDASVVYEAPVEANITRFLALYPATTVTDKVGPVRSARPYYLDWLAEYGDAMYMHVGGSPDALDRIDADNIFDINEMTHGWYFWRSDDRPMPHNTYTSTKLWQKAFADYAKLHTTPQSFDSWTFADSAPCETGCVDRVNVSFAPPAYVVEWRYVSSTSQYVRYQSGHPHLDQDSRSIVADTIIVQHVNVVVLDEVGRRGIDTTGSGSLTVFHDGYMLTGTWVKRGRTSRTLWLDQEGKTISLKPGKIWIEVVGGDNKVVTTDRI